MESSGWPGAIRLGAAVLERWLLRLVADYAERVLPVTREIADEWGRLNVTRSLPTADSLMAATARIQWLHLCHTQHRRPSRHWDYAARSVSICAMTLLPEQQEGHEGRDDRWKGILFSRSKVRL